MAITGTALGWGIGISPRGVETSSGGSAKASAVGVATTGAGFKSPSAVVGAGSGASAGADSTSSGGAPSASVSVTEGSGAEGSGAEGSGAEGSEIGSGLTSVAGAGGAGALTRVGSGAGSGAGISVAGISVAGVSAATGSGSTEVVAVDSDPRRTAQPNAPSPAAMGNSHHQAKPLLGAVVVGAVGVSASWARINSSAGWGKSLAGTVPGTGSVVGVWATKAGTGSARAFKLGCAVLSSSAATRILEEYGIVSRGSGIL